jgi:hypothetical protein
MLWGEVEEMHHYYSEEQAQGNYCGDLGGDRICYFPWPKANDSGDFDGNEIADGRVTLFAKWIKL